MKAIDPSLGTSMLQRLPQPGKTADDSKALREFDAYFLAQILKGAQSGEEEHLLDGGSAGRMYRDYFYDSIAKVLAERGDFGIAGQLKDSLSKATSAEQVAPERENDA